jgi:5,10-methylenetetrahydrofolate reductase
MAPEGVEKLCGVRQQLYTLTYCAGGSVQRFTLGTVRAIIAEGVAVPHSSCIGTSRESIREQRASARQASAASSRCSATCP